MMSDVERYLEGKHAIVTGGSRGIGSAIARALVSRGADVTIMGRTAETLERMAADLPENLWLELDDMTSTQSREPIP